MEAKKEALMVVLEAVRPALGKKDEVKGMTHFVFTGGAVTTYNGDMLISYPFETDLECSAKGDDLLEAVSVAEGEVELKVEDGVFKVTSENVKAEIPAILDKEASLVDTVNEIRQSVRDEDWKKVPTLMPDAFNFCKFSVSKNEDAGVELGVHVNAMYAWSTDGKRVSRYDLGEVADTFTIKGECASGIVGIGQPEKYCVTKEWVHFKTKDNLIISARQLLGKWKVERAEEIVNDFKGEEITLPSELSDVADTIAHFADDFDIFKIAEISISGDELEWSAGRKDGASIKVTRKLKTPIDKAIRFLINPVFLRDIMKKTRKIVIGKDLASFGKKRFKHIMTLPKEEK